jgi:hypothetical protein
MIPRVEHIGQQNSSSWPRRLRRWLSDLFGSDYVRLLEKDLLQARMERDRALADLKATQDRLLETMAATKGIPWRPLNPTEKPPLKPEPVPQTRWQGIYAQAMAENAKAEEEDRKKQESAPQEN